MFDSIYIPTGWGNDQDEQILAEWEANEKKNNGERYWWVEEQADTEGGYVL